MVRILLEHISGHIKEKKVIGNNQYDFTKSKCLWKVGYQRGLFWNLSSFTSLSMTSKRWWSALSPCLQKTPNRGDQLICSRQGLPSRGTQTGWRNSPKGTLKSSNAHLNLHCVEEEKVKTYHYCKIAFSKTVFWKIVLCISQNSLHNSSAS